jgi:hypothetical protein
MPGSPHRRAPQAPARLRRECHPRQWFSFAAERIDASGDGLTFAKDQQQDDAQEAEMRRLEKIERDLRRAICASRPTSRDGAIVQAIVASYLVRLVAEGARRKHLAHAHRGLISAISALISPETPPIAQTMHRQYFEMAVKHLAAEGGAA